jgi:N-acetylglucosaminylphosphatidylinositol deacetylase
VASLCSHFLVIIPKEVTGPSNAKAARHPTMSTLAILALLVGILPPILYSLISPIARNSLPTLRNKRICLLIAHPDDEAMFFAPTLLSLTRPEAGNHVKILCLSTGDADGLGETRKRELVKSGLHLGIKSEDDITVVNNTEDFPDSMTKTWEQGKVAGLLRSSFGGDANGYPSIDVLITFDEGGVSNHPNHISLFHGGRAFIHALLKGANDDESPVDMYTLTSINIARKYAGMGDALVTMIDRFFSPGADDETHPGALVFMSSLVGGDGATWGTAWKAMTEAHVSQMRWFRYGWICLSRYMVINDLKLELIEYD